MHRGYDAAVHPALRMTHHLRGWLVGVVSAITGPTAHAAATGMMPDSDAVSYTHLTLPTTPYV